MAQIKKIELSGSELSTDVGAVKKRPELEAKLAEGAVTGSMFIDIGNATAEVAGVLEKAHALAEKTASNNSFRIAQDSIMQRMEENPVYSEEQKTAYINELKTAIDEAAKKSSLPNARNEFASDADVQIELASHKISKVYNKRMKDEFQANTETLIDGFGTNYATSDLSDTLGREHWLLQKSTQYKQMAEAGYMTQKDAVRQDIATSKKWDERLMNYQAETNPDMTISELEKGENGFFKGVDQEARAKGLEKARAEKIKIDTTAEARQRVTHAQTTNEDFLLYTQGKLTQEKLDKDLNEGRLNRKGGEIDRRFYAQMSKALSSSDITAEKKSSGYKDVLKLMEDKKKANIADIQMKILQHKTDGTLSVDDAKSLADLTVIPVMQGDQPAGLRSLNELIAVEAKHNGLQLDRIKLLNNAITAFKAYNPITASDTAINLMRKFTDHVTKNGFPKNSQELSEVAKSIIKGQVLEDNPAIGNLPKEGARHIDAQGRVAHAFPDGDIKFDTTTATSDDEDEE